jgi:hypothetical protein
MKILLNILYLKVLSNRTFPLLKHQTLILLALIFGLFSVPTGVQAQLTNTVCDTFNDGNDTLPPPPWVHYDPLFGVTSTNPATFTFPNGGYRIVAPVPAAPDAGPARAGSFKNEVTNGDFYASVDLIDWDDTGRQAFGIIARAGTVGLSTTHGYLFSYELGGGTLPNTTGGDLDISRIDAENPTGLPKNGQVSGIHLTKGNHYRMVFIGNGFDFTGKIYDLTNTSQPLITLTGTDLTVSYATGAVGLVVASQGSDSASPTVTGDATFDNFLTTTAEPLLSAGLAGSAVEIKWPIIPFVLQGTSSLSPPVVWADITSGITQAGGQNVYTVSSPAASKFYRLNRSCP